MADIAVALDMSPTEQALTLVDAIGDNIAWYKVGPVLYVTQGPDLIRELQGRGKKIFLDLKWHDIPNTVSQAIWSAAGLGVSLVTVHLLGGRKMLAESVRARDASAGPALKVIGVGMLTSHSAQEFGDILGRPLDDAGGEQERLMRIGLESGLDGFVASGIEARAVREFAPRSLLVTPGIRRAADKPGDQQRTATPAEAVRAGADLLVIGRPISQAKDPAEAVRQIRQEMTA